MEKENELGPKIQSYNNPNFDLKIKLDFFRNFGINL